MTKVTVLAPLDFQWRPGQHCWVRVPHLSLLQNHPFTIANLPKVHTPGVKVDSETQNMIFYVRAHHGLTLDLLKSVTNHDDAENRSRSISVHIDGPYGGLIEDVPALYESLIFVAGGSGISACLPWIQYAARRITEGTSVTKSIRLVWMVRYANQIQWIIEELEPLISAHPDLIQVDFFVTDSSTAAVSSIESDKNSDNGVIGSKPSKPNEKSTTTVSPKLGQVHNQRPYLPTVLPTLITAQQSFILGKSHSQRRVVRIYTDAVNPRLRTREFKDGFSKCGVSCSKEGSCWRCQDYHVAHRVFRLVS